MCKTPNTSVVVSYYSELKLMMRPTTLKQLTKTAVFRSHLCSESKPHKTMTANRVAVTQLKETTKYIKIIRLIYRRGTT